MMNKLKMENGKLKIIVIIIAVLLVSTISIQQKSNPLSVNPSPYPISSPVSDMSKAIENNLTTDEQLILAPPPSSSESALKKHAETVKKLAQKGSVLGIKNCQPDPLVLEVKQGDKIEIRNNDNVVRKIMVDEAHTIVIQPNSTATISAKFKYGTGDYGYVCKDAGLVGFLRIVS